MSVQPTQACQPGVVTEADINDPGSPRNKYRTRESERQVRVLLMSWDAIGVAGVETAADEYDCMISPLLHLLHDGANAPAIRDWIVGEVEGHFGLHADPVREGHLADEIAAWWLRRLSDLPPVG